MISNLTRLSFTELGFKLKYFYSIDTDKLLENIKNSASYKVYQMTPPHDKSYLKSRTMFFEELFNIICYSTSLYTRMLTTNDNYSNYYFGTWTYYEQYNQLLHPIHTDLIQHCILSSIYHSLFIKNETIELSESNDPITQRGYFYHKNNISKTPTISPKAKSRYNYLYNKSKPSPNNDKEHYIKDVLSLLCYQDTKKHYHTHESLQHIAHFIFIYKEFNTLEKKLNEPSNSKTIDIYNHLILLYNSLFKKDITSYSDEGLTPEEEEKLISNKPINTSSKNNSKENKRKPATYSAIHHTDINTRTTIDNFTLKTALDYFFGFSSAEKILSLLTQLENTSSTDKLAEFKSGRFNECISEILKCPAANTKNHLLDYILNTLPNTDLVYDNYLYSPPYEPIFSIPKFSRSQIDVLLSFIKTVNNISIPVLTDTWIWICYMLFGTQEFYDDCINYLEQTLPTKDNPNCLFNPIVSVNDQVDVQFINILKMTFNKKRFHNYKADTVSLSSLVHNDKRLLENFQFSRAKDLKNFYRIY